MLNISTDRVEEIISDVSKQHILPYFGNLHHNDISFKKEDDPVTIADKRAESELSRRLLELLPGSKIIGEEAFSKNPAILNQLFDDSPVWIVDPLDGTKAFVSSDPVYGVIVSLALQNETRFGWLYDCTTNEFVTAQKGEGAYYKGTKLHVAEPCKLEDMTGIVCNSILTDAHYHLFSKEIPCPHLHRMASACHDLASLAVSVPHFARRHLSQTHFHATSHWYTPWDMAAGLLIFEEAGGYTAHWDGKRPKPSNYGRGLLSAPNEDMWSEIKNWLKTFTKIQKIPANFSAYTTQRSRSLGPNSLGSRQSERSASS